ncbi:helix-turn-helix domain-containing protein [Hippea maritima]|uniref:Cupin 2 conserved barrel domain protein n=1 Tax=Hippea maritima (strain ATCC 700847 / DSM 10411 / MH2) TaxID=760142 RepID=F2LX47_HIPMA|nr:XRE family transcriptional regulator [Hippea maritima]AEA33105.1 Cupin 2 conserved barrel domain protein [Hippea maritima DSM 10411]
MRVGSKIREIRTKKNMTLRDLSKKSGCSLGFLSQVERDLVSPTISSLRRIADALGINIISLFEEREPPVDSIVVRKTNRGKFENRRSRVKYELLRPQFSDTTIEALYMYLEPGAISGTSPHSHNGEELVIVLKGKLEIEVGGKSYLLEEGDSAVYNSNLPHKWRNSYEGTTEVIWVNHPPTF